MSPGGSAMERLPRAVPRGLKGLGGRGRAFSWHTARPLSSYLDADVRALTARSESEHAAD